MSNSLILIGFKSSGKTTLAKQLAGMMGLTFVDLDELMLAKFGYDNIQQCFKLLGETKFRHEEEQLAQDLLIQSQAMIVATGGGAVLNPKLMTSLKRMGKIVFLNTPYEVIESRLFKDTETLFYLNRSFNKAELKALYDSRLNHYLTHSDWVIGDQ